MSRSVPLWSSDNHDAAIPRLVKARIFKRQDGIRLLSDQIVRVRAPAVCNTCEGPVIKGSFARRRTEVYDGDLERFAWCELCCVAMADPDPAGWEAREAMGFERRAKFEGGVL